MCYEFVHPCDGKIIDQINILVGESNYFMVCIGHLNYIYCSEQAVIDKMKGLLFMNGMVLHLIEEKELIDILDFPDTKPYQAFHGSKLLYNQFIAAYQKS